MNADESEVHVDRIVDDGVLDATTASAMIADTTQDAQRKFNVWPPLLLVVGAVLFPMAFWVVWHSVRTQHPYVGPTGGALAVFYSIIVVWIVTVSVVVRRATSGVSGRSMRQRKFEGYAFIGLWIAVYVFQGALEHAGAGKGIVYGIYPATAPFIFVGGAYAVSCAVREDWPRVAAASFMAVVGIAAAFTGPVTVWLVVGIGLGVLLLAVAIAQVSRRRTSGGLRVH